MGALTAALWRSRGAALLAAAALAAGLVASPSTASAVSVSTLAGSFSDGAAYKLQVPTPWNGTLVLYSHGYVGPGGANPALDVGDPATGQWLLDHGYALAGSSYSSTGWAVQDAFRDQVQVLDLFSARIGRPRRTIAWGHSMGGMITAGLVQLYPDRFDGALPMCGVVAGGVAIWNQVLDAAFAFETLLAPGSGLQLVHAAAPAANLAQAKKLAAAAQSSAQGRARLALAAALADVPGWFSPGSPEPAATDYAARERDQYLWSTQTDFAFAFGLRAELEARAGGNPSWNTGVDYRRQLQESAERDEVVALYRQAGLDLDADLETLARAPRIAADPAAVDYLARYVSYDGQLSMPVLTMHTTGDGLVVPEGERSYGDAVREEGNEALLRQVYVHRAGHCTFTPAETVAAFQALVHRLDSGRWDDAAEPARLTEQAGALQGLDSQPPAFVEFQPRELLRPFTALSG